MLLLLILVFSYAQNTISNTLQHKQVNTRPGCACFSRSYYVKNKENGGFAMPEKKKKVIHLLLLNSFQGRRAS